MSLIPKTLKSLMRFVQYHQLLSSNNSQPFFPLFCLCDISINILIYRYHLLAKLLQSLALGERYIYTFPSFLCSTLNQVPPFILSNLQMISSKDANFLGYTFKNLEIVDEHHIPGMGQ